jgi:hypothetical protein
LIASGPADPAQHLEFLTDLLSRITRDKSPDAHVLVLSTLAHAKLLFGDLEGSKTDIDAAWKILDNVDAVENSVNGAYYRVAADYYKVCVTENFCGTSHHVELSRQKPNMRRITGTRCFTLRALTWRRIYHRTNVSYVHMIWHFQPSWLRRSIILANWYVAQLTVSPELRLSLRRFDVVDWCCVANAPHLGLVGRHSS